jgi:hypothetical protein
VEIALELRVLDYLRVEYNVGLTRIDPLTTRRIADVDFPIVGLGPSRAIPAWPAGSEVLLSTKSFHGVPAGNVHKCLLKTRLGKARRVGGHTRALTSLRISCGHEISSEMERRYSALSPFLPCDN